MGRGAAAARERIAGDTLSRPYGPILGPTPPGIQGPGSRSRCPDRRGARACERHPSFVPPTVEDRCDWCYGPLTNDDLTTPLGQALGVAETAACRARVARGDVLRPPDSLHPADVEVAGRDAWALTVGALLSPEPSAASSSAGASPGRRIRRLSRPDVPVSGAFRPLELSGARRSDRPLRSGSRRHEPAFGAGRAPY